jgi:hypothetical protein
MKDTSINISKLKTYHSTEKQDTIIHLQWSWLPNNTKCLILLVQSTCQWFPTYLHCTHYQQHCALQMQKLPVSRFADEKCIFILNIHIIYSCDRYFSCLHYYFHKQWQLLTCITDIIINFSKIYLTTVNKSMDSLLNLHSLKINVMENIQLISWLALK